MTEETSEVELEVDLLRFIYYSYVRIPLFGDGTSPPGALATTGILLDADLGEFGNFLASHQHQAKAKV